MGGCGVPCCTERVVDDRSPVSESAVDDLGSAGYGVEYGACGLVLGLGGAMF